MVFWILTYVGFLFYGVQIYTNIVQIKSECLHLLYILGLLYKPVDRMTQYSLILNVR